MSDARPALTLYMHRDCHLCVEARADIEMLQRELDFDLREVDIHSDEALLRAYCERVPVVALGGRELCDLHVDNPLLREALIAAGATRAARGI